jgi:ppGpp synthetase/RelA/SpoT-type nucleotidyltranferase
LNRQRIRLTQIQDIAGLRLLVDNVLEQDRLIQQLRTVFPQVSIDDRRIKPSHGYRAMHAIVTVGERWVEIQIRTQEQHLWAEWSEKLSDVEDPAIKYGGGPDSLRKSLLDYSQFVQPIHLRFRRNHHTD